MCHVVSSAFARANVQSLALNGVDGVDDSLWQLLSGAAAADGNASMEVDGVATVAASLGTGGVGGGAAAAGGLLLQDLESLSLVRCSQLHTLCLGLVPESPPLQVRLGPKDAPRRHP